MESQDSKTSKKKRSEDDETDQSFEAIVARLGELVQQLEQGDMPLEHSLKVFEEGVKLSRLGTERLDEAERRIEYLLSQDDNAQNGGGAKS